MWVCRAAWSSFLAVESRNVSRRYLDGPIRNLIIVRDVPLETMVVRDLGLLAHWTIPVCISHTSSLVQVAQDTSWDKEHRQNDRRCPTVRLSEEHRIGAAASAFVIPAPWPLAEDVSGFMPVPDVAVAYRISVAEPL